jgi:hypothetical protein
MESASSTAICVLTQTRATRKGEAIAQVRIVVVIRNMVIKRGGFAKKNEIMGGETRFIVRARRGSLLPGHFPTSVTGVQLELTSCTLQSGFQPTRVGQKDQRRLKRRRLLYYKSSAIKNASYGNRNKMTLVWGNEHIGKFELIH